MHAGDGVATRQGDRSAWTRVTPVVLALAVSVFAAGAHATPQEDTSVRVFNGHPHDALYAVSFEGKDGIAVGDFGMVVSSSNGGASWSRRETPFTDLAMFGVVRRNGRCIAVGQQGAVYTSPDCVSWTASAPVTQARLLAVDVNADGVAYAAGGFGALLKSSDWGVTWTLVQPDWKTLTPDGAEPHLYAVKVGKDGNATVVGEFELILRSNGSNWKSLHSGRRSLFGFTLLDSGEGYAVGQEGVVLKTADFGDTWHAQGVPTKTILTDVLAMPRGQIVISGVYTLLSSTDRGTTWRRDSAGEVGRSWYQAVGEGVDAKGVLRAIAVGAGGEIRSIRVGAGGVTSKEDKN
jgi:photosystem II stability/assembly factor-like uncharacterized protein